MGSFNSKLTSEERLQLETAAKQKHVVLIISSLETLDPMCIKFMENMLRPLCKQLSVLYWHGNDLIIPGKGNAMDIMRSAQKIVLVHVRVDATKRFDLLSEDMLFGGLNSYLQARNFDINTHGRLICCHISDNCSQNRYDLQPYLSYIHPLLIKRREHIITAISVNIPFTRRWGSFEEPDAAIEHLLMALEMPMNDATMEPLRKILAQRVRTMA